MPKLKVIITSTRPGRAGLPIGTWFAAFAKTHGAFDVELVDLAAVNLPLLDEPNHPRLGQYVHEHTKAWSAIVRDGDAFVFVLPEYNFFPPPSFVNAIDYLANEWAYKPAGLVSYGGLSGGLRSAQASKSLLTSMNVMPIPEAVVLPFFTKQLQDGVFKGDEAHEKSGRAMLDELARWASALAPLRAR